MNGQVGEEKKELAMATLLFNNKTQTQTHTQRPKFTYPDTQWTLVTHKEHFDK